MSKICTKCKIDKNIEEYSKNKSKRDGLKSHCKSCIKLYDDSNKDKIAEYQKLYREVNQEKLAEHKKLYREVNSEKIAERKKAYGQLNRGRLLELPTPSYQNKVCSTCKMSKPLVDFNKNKSTKYGYGSQCKPCAMKSSKAYRLDNPNYTKNLYKLNRETQLLANKLYRDANKTRIAERKKSHRLTTVDAQKAYSRKYHAENRERLLEQNRLYRECNKDKIDARRKNNPDIYEAKLARRRTTKLSACPPWYDLVKDEVKAIYAERARLTKLTGVMHHVDHTHPLQHPLVCGLHVAANLRVITATENLQKHNKFTPYVESEL